MRSHPFWRAAMLAAVLCVCMVMLGSVDMRWVFRIRGAGRPLLAMALMMAVGAFLSGIPSRLRRRNGPFLRSGWRNCLLSFASGVLLMLGAFLADMDTIAALCGVLQGGIGALVFFGIVWVCALGTSRLTGRWRV